ncbi:MAG: beta-ketoacyl synthase N-terminal-like domain-containing protein, partial [Deltaproteobacteria bacterium]|nr:beta-ketoacyl synthase N-terminal-like domain-containing protein [Deltaproteobacteria bacterium]
MAQRKSVAIIGVGGEFPNSPTLNRYWENIVNNVDTSRKPPEGRWLLSPDRVYDPQVGAADRVYSQKACFLEDETEVSSLPGLELDATFLASLDPMYRLLLRVGQQTLSGLQTDKLKRTSSGIILGNLALPSEKSSQLARYLLGQPFVEKLSDQPLSTHEQPVASVNHYVAGLPAGLLAKALGFQGTCFTVDAACASSLYAIKLAADELISGRADSMLAGGLSRPDSLYTQMGFSQLRALSPTGSCAPFDQQGNGLVVGEGCGLVLLKRTEDAIRDGDPIYAVIRGLGLSNDLEGNLLAPASEGQLRAMRSAYQQAGWAPSDVDLVECHATGTPVGDAVEFNSLRTLWEDLNWRSGQCVIGSVKANIGHLLTAAGAAALIKTLLAIKHQILPPMVNFSSPAQGIELDDSPFKILQQASRWEARGTGKPRRAAVSAFGFGGINAHLLIEEWLPAQKSKRSIASHPSFQQKSDPIAIVGMDAHFGPWDSLEKFQQRVFGYKKGVLPQPPRTWWGVEKTQWFKKQGFHNIPFTGHFIPEISTETGEFRIPPKELEEMLPRQLLMLKVAAAALKDAQISREDLLFTGIFIGCGLDLNATNFSFRWGMENYAKIWAQELGLTLDEKQLADWVTQLRDTCGPPLTANRTMGALGSVVASRIAKNFRIGGPSFTLSSEENSGLRALEVAVHSLQEGSINRAVVGAVDLAGDLRNVLSRHEHSPYSPTGEGKPFDQHADGSLIGEGAAAVVLKRLVDAKQDGDKIYAVIRGLGTAIQGQVESFRPQAAAYSLSLERACQNAKTQSGSISYIEAEGSGIPEIDQLESRELGRFLGRNRSPHLCRIGSVKADIGHAGAAAGLASLVKVALCLNQRILPPIRNTKTLGYDWIHDKRKCSLPHEPQYWLTDQALGPRLALLGAIGGDGSCSHVVLEECAEKKTFQSSFRPLGSLPEGLFAVAGHSSDAILAGLQKLREFSQVHTDSSIDDLARDWWNLNPINSDRQACLCLVTDNRDNLNVQLDFATASLNADPLRQLGPDGNPQISPVLRDRIFYTPKPLHKKGKIAFVFPGSGNHFAGMGAELSAHWPQIYRAQEATNQYLASQYLPGHFWKDQLDEILHENHNALVISHVALCTALSDLVRFFGIEPEMISGYSLGESAGLFASRAWTDRDGMLQRLRESTLFTQDLAGECRAAQRVWGLQPGQKIDWLLGIVDLPAEKIRTYLRGKKQVYLLIINTYRESVVGGQRAQVEALVEELGCHFIPLQGVTTVHCDVTKAVANAYRKLHLFAVTPPAGVDFYSCALGKKYPLTTEHAADVILAQALETVDYPQVIEELYAEGARIFLEVGPGASCSRMINSILEDRPHMTRSLCVQGQEPVSQLLRLLAHCLAEGVAVDMAKLYPLVETKAETIMSQTSKIKTTISGQSFSPQLPVNSFIASETKY